MPYAIKAIGSLNWTLSRIQCVKMKNKEILEPELEQVTCNQCGKKLLVQDGIVKEGCFSVRYKFDYFSNKDGYIYNLDLCEECFDKWNSQFTIPVQIEETKEFL